MPQWLANMVPAGMEQIVSWLVAATIVIALVFVVLTIARKAMGGSGGPRAKGRGPRLAIMDVTAIDTKRKLVLVRRDEIEHLLLIGGQNDLVVEPGILRVPASARSQRTEPTMRPEPEAPMAERTPPSPAVTAAPVPDLAPAPSSPVPAPAAPPVVPVVTPAVAIPAAAAMAAPAPRSEPSIERSAAAPAVPAQRLAPSTPPRPAEPRATSPLSRPVPRAPSMPASPAPEDLGPSIAAPLQASSAPDTATESRSASPPKVQEVPAGASIDRDMTGASVQTAVRSNAPSPASTDQAPSAPRPGTSSSMASSATSMGAAPIMPNGGRTAGEALASAMRGGSERNSPTVDAGEDAGTSRSSWGDERQADARPRAAAMGAGSAMPADEPASAIFPTGRSIEPTAAIGGPPSQAADTDSRQDAPRPAAAAPSTVPSGSASREDALSLPPQAPQPVTPPAPFFARPASEMQDVRPTVGTPPSQPLGSPQRPMTTPPSTTPPSPTPMGTTPPVPMPFGPTSFGSAPASSVPVGQAASNPTASAPRSMATPTVPAKPPETPAASISAAGAAPFTPMVEQPKRPDVSLTPQVSGQPRPAPASGPAQGFALGGYMPGAFAPGGASIPVFSSANPARPAAATSSVIAAAERQRDALRQRPVKPASDEAASRTDPQMGNPSVTPPDRPAPAEEIEAEKKPLSVRSFATTIQSMKPSFEPAPAAATPAAPTAPAPALGPERREAQGGPAPVVTPPSVAVAAPLAAPVPVVRPPAEDQGDSLEDFLSAELDSDFGNVRWEDDVTSTASAAPEVRPDSPKAPEVVPDSPATPRALTLEEEMERLLGDFDFEVSDRKAK